jgi:isopentenyl diphosphate isomerase/L-lactate dehydrogenase-like FMN-dependent dehydrogenase
VLYGVAAAGMDGAKRALDIFREEIERDLGLLGVRSVPELNPRLLIGSSRLRRAADDDTNNGRVLRYGRLWRGLETL